MCLLSCSSPYIMAAVAFQGCVRALTTCSCTSHVPRAPPWSITVTGPKNFLDRDPIYSCCCRHAKMSPVYTHVGSFVYIQGYSSAHQLLANTILHCLQRQTSSSCSTKTHNQACPRQHFEAVTMQHCAKHGVVMAGAMTLQGHAHQNSTSNYITCVITPDGSPR
jgi:hypothetical protein